MKQPKEQYEIDILKAILKLESEVTGDSLVALHIDSNTGIRGRGDGSYSSYLPLGTQWNDILDCEKFSWEVINGIKPYIKWLIFKKRIKNFLKGRVTFSFFRGLDNQKIE